MLTVLWTSFLALLAGTLSIAWIVALMYEKGIRPIRSFAAFFKKQKMDGRIVFGALFIAFGILASVKQGGDGNVANVEMLPMTNANSQLENGSIGTGNNSTLETFITSTNTTRTLTGDDFRRGFVLVGVGTGEAHDFSPPPGASVCDDWRAFGGAEDWFYATFTNWSFHAGSNVVNRFRIHSDGWVKAGTTGVSPVAWMATFCPFKATLGIAPETNWALLPANYQLPSANYKLPSRFWHYVTPSNTLQLTWQGALAGLDTNTPVDVQMEAWPDGRFTYRYDLSRYGGTGTMGILPVDGVTVGASFVDNGWTTNSLPTNITSLAYWPLVAEDAVNLDRDGDGIPLLDELFFYGTAPDLWDSDGDGVSDGAEVASGTDPLARDQGDGLTGGTASPDFRSECGAAADRIVAWEIAPSAFSFARPAGLTNIVSRTFRVDRTSPWQQFYVSSRPNGAAGWDSSDVSVRYVVDGGTVTNEVPSASADSWRLPLGPGPATNVTFIVEAAGVEPALSRPLHLLRWSPHVTLAEDEAGRFLNVPEGKAPVFLSRRREESGWYVVPFSASLAGVPHVGGVDADAAAELALPPCAGLVVTNAPTRAFLVSDPVWAELPPEGTNVPVRVCCWELAHETPGAIGSGPRATPFDSPYPLSSPALRRAFHRARGIRADSSSPVTVKILPEHPLVGLYAGGASRQLLRGSGGTTNEPPGEVDVYPPDTVTPGFDDVPDGDDAYSVDADTPDEGPEESPSEDDGGCDDPDPEKDDCDCAGDGDGTSQCSFRLRISLGSPTPGETAGFVWTSLDEPTAVTPAVFNVLGTDAVAATTNAIGEFTVTCSAPAGRTVQVTNIAHGVALTAWNASGRLENRWEVTNPDGDTWRVRCRKLTILGNAVSDETFDLNDGMYGLNGVPDGSRVAGTYPDECVTRRDETRGIFTIKSKWRTDPDDPDFVTDVHDETVLEDWTGVSSAMSEFAKVGAGSLARRRLARRYGYDERGPFSEEMAYWCDPENPYRHARLKSVRSDRRPWSFHDYDAQGRETVRLEQLDGSPFPESLAEVSHLAELPQFCSAKATVTSYETPEGDSRDRNDAFLPRRRDTWVMRAGSPLILIGTETWLYTRTEDANGIALRTCVHASGVGDTLRTETTVAYPEDYAVPKELRGRTVSRVGPDGVAETSTVEKGTWDESSRTFTPGPDGAFLRTTTSRTRNGAVDDTYGVAVEDSLRRLAVFNATRLSGSDALVEFEQSTYDDIDRLRSTAYLDGTSLTNAYSCCRLLWTRDRQDRTTLRSAQTGTDDLYHAEEDVWLADVANHQPPTTNHEPRATNHAFRITQHFCDGLGRETNTVTYAGTTPGEAAVSIGEAALLPLQSAGGSQLVATATTTYPYGGSDYSIHTDERGARTITTTSYGSGYTEQTSYTTTNYTEVLRTTTRTYHGGGSSTRREWLVPPSAGGSQLAATVAWTEERRFTEYAPNGYRIDYVVTTSSDYPAVTNSISTYGLLGRLVTTATPIGEAALPPLQSGPTGTTGVSPLQSGTAWLVTSNTYDGATSRILTSTRYAPTLAPRTTTYIYNDWGEQVGTVLDGITNRTDVTYAQISNEWWKVETSTVIGPSTNSLTITRTQLTGLSNTCRRHTVTVTGTQGVTSIGEAALSPLQIGTTTDSLTTYDPTTGIETETITSSTGPTIIRRYLHGVLLSTETSGETTFNSYDAFARVVSTSRTGVPPVQEGSPIGEAALSPLQSYTYSPVGDLLATHTYTNGTDILTENYAYDMLGNRIATTDAHGNTTYRTYDPFGRVLAEWGATYPVRYTYDTQGRRTSLTTFRTTGAVALVATGGDTTTWTYDPYTSLCTSKTYADGSTISYSYTPDNLPLRTTYASGKWKENVYDFQRRLCGVVYSSPDMGYELQLDDYGNATNVQDAAGNTWRYDYGFNSTLLAEKCATSGGPRSVAATNNIVRAHDSFDRPTGYALSINGVSRGGIGYAYDDDGVLTHITTTNAAGRSFTVAYTNNTGYNYGYTLTTPSGNTIRRVVDRDDYRRNLVTNCATYFNSSLVDSNLYAFDALSRPIARTTGTTGVSSVDSIFSYNNRSEVVSAAIGTNYFTHVYDDIGNHLLFGDNAVTNTYTHNNLNQITTSHPPPASPRTIHHNADGGLSSDGTWSYAYDAEDQLRSVTSRSLTNGAIRVLNTYDYRHRRTSKTVQRLNSTIPPPPAPPTGTQEWETIETRTFVYDDWNLIHETIYSIDGSTTNATEVQYFCGLDLSDSLQGAGGVGGLLAVSRNGEFYFPAYDNNGNVTKYIDESSNIVAVYEYDDFGRIISQTGPLADLFCHRFSTKYYDSETGLYYYGYRFYSPDWRIWLNCDPIEEVSGVNLSEFCFNDPISVVDILGLENYCHCFDYSVTVMRRDNWTNIFSAHYHEDEVLDGSVVGWSTGKTLWIDRNYVEQVNVTITRKDGDCSCGDGTYEGTNYKPYVTIDGPHSRRTDGKAIGEFAWTQRQDISGPKFHDKVISQNVIKRQRGTRMAYKVVITDGFDNVCGTREFFIQY